MVQPSYPHTVELPHSRPYSQKEFNSDGSLKVPELDEAPGLAPSDRAPLDSHANDFDSGHAERPDTTAVNPESAIRVENSPGPGVPD